jgi:hypothetical protein
MIKELLRFVVVWARSICKPPKRQGTIAIFFYGALEALDGFFAVEAVGPDQTTVEPPLRRVACHGDGPVVVAQVIGILVGWHTSSRSVA